MIVFLLFVWGVITEQLVTLYKGGNRVLTLYKVTSSIGSNEIAQRIEGIKKISEGEYREFEDAYNIMLEVKEGKKQDSDLMYILESKNKKYITYLKLEVVSEYVFLLFLVPLIMTVFGWIVKVIRGLVKSENLSKGFNIRSKY